MNEKVKLKKQIHEFDFALYELALFLDTHPTNRKALELLKEYRRRREMAVAEYESRFGKYIVTLMDVPTDECWKWTNSPWPWDPDFMEG